MTMRHAVILALAWALMGCVSSGKPSSKPDGSPKEAAQINYELGSQYLRQGNLKLARERLERAVEQDPKLPGPYTALAILYVRTGDSVQAENSYRQALRVAPKDANVQNSFAVFLCNRGQYEEGQKYFLRAATNTSNRSPEVAFTNAGVCALEQKNRTVAERHFRSALQRNRDFGDALLQMAVLSFDNDDAFSARAFLARFSAKNPMSAEALLLCVRVENALGDEDALGECADQLRRDFPDSKQRRQLNRIINAD